MKAKDQISGAETAAPDPKPPTKHALDGEIIKVHKGVAIYKTHASGSASCPISFRYSAADQFQMEPDNR